MFLAATTMMGAGAVAFGARITTAGSLGKGYVDGLRLEGGAKEGERAGTEARTGARTGARLAVVSGWAGSLRPGLGLISVSVYLGAREIYAGLADSLERPDVATGMNRPEWLNSGWRVAVPIPETMEKGRYPVRVRAQLEDGEEFDLMNTTSAREIEIP